MPALKIEAEACSEKLVLNLPEYTASHARKSSMKLATTRQGAYDTANVTEISRILLCSLQDLLNFLACKKVRCRLCSIKF
jgi:hypothetical protein